LYGIVEVMNLIFKSWLAGMKNHL